MQQPKLPNAVPSSPSSSSPSPPTTGGAPPSSKTGSRLSTKVPPTPPTAEELVAHYESQGLDYKEASLKAIRLLQGFVYRAAMADRKGKGKGKAGGGDLGVSTERKLDSLNARLVILESKIDSKPGFPGAFTTGVAAGIAAPMVLGGLQQVWGFVRSATANQHSSSS